VTDFLTRQDNEPSKPKPIKENVVEGVLQNYLDQLLVTATQPQRVEKAIHIPDVDEPDVVNSSVIETPKSIAEKALTENTLDPVSEPLLETEQVKVELIRAQTVLAPKVEAVIAPVAETISTLDTVIDVSNISNAVSEGIESVIKQSMLKLTDQESWSSQGVECLLFSVSGLKLAVPLLLLGGVHEVISDDVKPLIGQPKWYLGLIHREDQNLQVIDTATFIMPERAESLAEQGYKYLIQLEKSPWAIACQSIDDTVRLEASEIKWRGDRGKRVWLAGTVIEKMCALIDVSGLLQRVESSCKPV
jgi:purine-binding chemotaxis protein CheW